MERKPSRPKSRTLKTIERDESDAGSQNASAERTTKYWPCSIVICPLILCILTALFFLQQFATPDSLHFVLASPKTHHGETLHSQVHNPDLARPSIELHPEDHVYRGPVTQHLDWVITDGYLRPDGVLKQVYLVNGKIFVPLNISCSRVGTLITIRRIGIFPGPTLEARSGDTLIINVTNALQGEPISIHWHGLHVQSKSFFSTYA